MTAPLGLEHRLQSLRDAFDRAFAVAPITTVETFEDMLAIRIGGDAYALRVREMKGLVASRKIVALPSRKPSLLGVAGIRGSLVAVYSLAGLLGYGADSKAPSWFALAGAGEPVGLGFDELEGFLRVPSACVHAARAAEGARPHVVEVVRIENQSRSVVDSSSTLAALEIRAGIAGSPKES